MGKRKVSKKGETPAIEEKAAACSSDVAGTAEDRHAFISGFPMDAEEAEAAIHRLFRRACMENCGDDSMIAGAEIGSLLNLLVEQVYQCAVQSPETDRGKWAGRLLADLTNLLIAASPGLKVEWNKGRITPAIALSRNAVFLERLKALRTRRGQGTKAIRMRGAGVARFVLATWGEALEVWNASLLMMEMGKAEPDFPYPPDIEGKKVLEVLNSAELALRKPESDRNIIAREVFKEILAEMLESRWDRACNEFPDMALAARSAANEKGMMSAFSAKRDNLRDAWLSIAAGENGLNRLLV